MSRTADHAARKRQVATALMQVISESGLDSASLPRIAEKAGVSVGLIQRYFRTKDELLDFAFDHLTERARERIEQLNKARSFQEGLFNALHTLLPMDDERIAEGRVFLAYMARSATNPALADKHRKSLIFIRERCADTIERAKRFAQYGTVAESVGISSTANKEAAMLTSFVDGLMVHMVSAPGCYSAKEAEQALSSYLDKLFAYYVYQRSSTTSEPSHNKPISGTT
jgi:AcrR family transcriptional regulator